MKINLPLLSAMIAVPVTVLLLLGGWLSGWTESQLIEAFSGAVGGYALGVMILSIIHKLMYGSWGWR